MSTSKIINSNQVPKFMFRFHVVLIFKDERFNHLVEIETTWYDTLTSGTATNQSLESSSKWLYLWIKHFGILTMKSVS